MTVLLDTHFKIFGYGYVQTHAYVYLYIRQKFSSVTHNFGGRHTEKGRDLARDCELA